jgi:hypothetical protein
MLKAMDNVVERFIMRINASKTKIMSMGKGTSQLPVDVTINGGLVELVDQFKYLGGVLSSDIKTRCRSGGMPRTRARGFCPI